MQVSISILFLGFLLGKYVGNFLILFNATEVSLHNSGKVLELLP